MASQSQANLICGRFSENHPENTRWGQELDEGDRCDGAGDDQNWLDVRGNPCCPLCIVLSPSRIMWPCSQLHRSRRRLSSTRLALISPLASLPSFSSGHRTCAVLTLTPGSLPQRGSGFAAVPPEAAAAHDDDIPSRRSIGSLN